ncbi:MAG: aspartate dehydrogenase domain-containing protein [Haloferacaceae archaeon]
MTHTVGLIGYGRIGRDLADRIEAAPDTELAYVHVRSEKAALPSSVQITDPDELGDRPVDLVVEAATPAALSDLAGTVLSASDLLVLSGSAFADPEAERRLTDLAAASAGEMYLPHAALFGVDGLVDARDELDAVHIEATKAPDHLDFEYAGPAAPDLSIDPDDPIEGETVVYEGPVRGLCRRFPRNFNSHATVALASLGLDDTTSRLIADPDAETAHHVITASGEGFDLEAVRDSDIEGVTGDYTLVSTWGSVRRVLRADDGPQFV